MRRKYRLDKHYPNIERPSVCPICASTNIGLAFESTKEYACLNLACASYPYTWDVFAGLHIKIYPNY